MVFNATLNNI